MQQHIPGYGLTDATYHTGLGFTTDEVNSESTVVMPPNPTTSERSVSLSRTKTITHTNSKEQSVKIYWKGYCTGTSDSYAPYQSSAVYTTISIPAIDLSPPVLTSYTASAVTETSALISLKADSTCNKWEYKVDSKSWVTFSTASASSVTYTITGLTSDVHAIYFRITKKSNAVTSSATYNTSVDLVLPTVEFTVSDIGTNSFKFTAITSETCNRWWYSLNDGVDWIQISTLVGTSITKTVSDLDINTSYPVRIKAKKSSNGLSGVSTVNIVSTVGNTIINSVKDIYLDVFTIKEFVLRINMSVFVKEYFTKVNVLYGGNVIIERFLAPQSKTGVQDIGIGLLDEERRTLLNLLGASNYQIPLVLEMISYETRDESSQIGESSHASFYAKVSYERSKPTISWSITDSNQYAVDNLTGNNLTFIKGLSTPKLDVTINANNGALAKNIFVDDTPYGCTGSTYSKTVHYDNVPESIVLNGVDSRGFKAYESDAVIFLKDIPGASIINYIQPTLSCSFRRTIPVSENKLAISFSGACYGGSFGIKQNNIVVSYQYKAYDSDVWSSTITIPRLNDKGGYNYLVGSNSFYMPKESSGIVEYVLPDEIDYTKQYTIKVTVTDSVNSTPVTVTLDVPAGLPIFDWGKNDFTINKSLYLKSLDARSRSIKIADMTLSANQLQDLINKLDNRDLPTPEKVELYSFLEKLTNNYIEYQINTDNEISDIQSSLLEVINTVSGLIKSDTFTGMINRNGNLAIKPDGYIINVKPESPSGVYCRIINYSGTETQRLHFFTLDSGNEIPLEAETEVTGTYWYINSSTSGNPGEDPGDNPGGGGGTSPPSGGTVIVDDRRLLPPNGNTGDILMKTTHVDYDVEWVGRLTNTEIEKLLE